MAGNTITSRSSESDDQLKFWQDHVRAWKDSGLSQRTYCRQHHLREERFSHWKSRLAHTDASSCFVPVPIKATLAVAIQRRQLSVYAPNGFRVEVSADFDAAMLKKLLAVVQEV
jgi:hypothetical protein